MIRRAIDVVLGSLALVLPPRDRAWRCSPSAWSRAGIRSTGSAEWVRTGGSFDLLEAAHHGRRRRAHRRGSRHQRERPARHARGRLPAQDLAGRAAQPLNVVRGDMSFIGPRPTIPAQVAQYTERQRGRLAIRPGITGWAQVNGRASLPWSERIELDLYYIEHRSLVLDAAYPVAHRERSSSAAPASTRARRGDGRVDELRSSQSSATRSGLRPDAAEPVAIMLTGVGKRYDIVSCFAAHATVVAVDPNPLAPARYAAHVRACAPPIDDPEYIPELARLCERSRRERGPPAHRSRHREAGERTRARCPPRARALRGGGPRHLRQVRGPSPAGAPGPALAPHRAPRRGGPRRARLPRHGQAAAGLRGPLDTPRSRLLSSALLRRVREGAHDGPARHGGPRAVDRLPRRPRAGAA